MGGAVLMAVAAMATGVGMADESTNAVLDDLVILNRVPQHPRDVPAAVSVVTAPQVVQANAVGTAELLRQVPGMDVQGSGFPGAVVKPILRGLSPGLQSKPILVLVDGRRVAEPYQSAVEFSLMPSDNIDHVEVLKGPASALYGSDALAGVINIVTRRGTPTPVADARVGYGSYNTQQARVRQGWQQGPIDYFVTASYLDTDGYTKNSDGTDRDWRAENLTGNFGLTAAPNAELRFYTGYYGAEGSDESSDREIDKDYEQGDLTWNWDDARDAVLLVRAYRNGDDQVYNWKFPGRGVYDMQTLGTEIQQSLWMGDRHRVTGGADFRREDVDATDVTGPVDEHSIVSGAYAQDEFALSEVVTLVGGVRGDHDNAYGSELSPHASALWRVDPSAELFAGVARGHRDPSLSDRYFRGEYDGRMFEGNPDLTPEILMAYEAGGRARVAEAVSVEVTTFYNDLDDAFEFAADPDGVYRNRNVASSRTYGVESGLRYEATRRLDLFATYTHTEGDYRHFPTDPSVEGNQLQYLAPDVASAGAAWDGGHFGTHALSGNYVSARYADERNSAEGRLDDYIVVNWRSRLPLGDHMALTLNLDNLFDTDYAEFADIEQPGFTALGGFEVAL